MCKCKEMPTSLMDPKRIIRKNWRAEEEERHKGLMTPPPKKKCRPSKYFFFFFVGSATPSASPSPGSSFLNYSFLVHHLVNRVDWHLLALGNGL
jgi:hypothetical protein